MIGALKISKARADWRARFFTVVHQILCVACVTLFLLAASVGSNFGVIRRWCLSSEARGASAELAGKILRQCASAGDVVRNGFAAETVSEEIIEVLPPNYPYSSSTTFTPFDFSAETRMSGRSGVFDYDEYNRFTQIYPIDIRIEKPDTHELAFWAYFSTPNLHNLAIRLLNSSGNYALKIEVSSSDLAQLLTKTYRIDRLDVATDGFAWNYIECPLAAAAPVNCALTDSLEFDKIEITYYSDDEQIDGQTNYSKVYIFNAVVTQTDLSGVTIQGKNKQDYRLFSVNFYEASELNQICVGDSIMLAARNNLIKYAWIGEININENSAFIYNNYPLKVTVTNSEGTSSWSMGETHMFSAVGQHIIRFEITNSNDTQVVYNAVFSVSQFIGISFNAPIRHFEVGKTICLTLNKNANIVNLSDLNFEIIGECGKIVSVDEANARVYVKTTGEGLFKIKASAVADRLFKSGVSVSAQTEITVKNEYKKDNTALVIIISSIIAGIIVIGVVLGIKSIITANKYKVR